MLAVQIYVVEIIGRVEGQNDANAYESRKECCNYILAETLRDKVSNCCGKFASSLSVTLKKDLHKV